LCLLAIVWFGINLLQLLNPTGVSLIGGLSEIRTTAFNWLYIVPLCFLFFNTRKHLDFFLILVIGCSVIATLYGMKQLHIGLDAADLKFLFEDGAAKTHLIFGKLRVFSFYSDAGQFGASQAQLGLIAVILAFGPFKFWKKVLLLLAGGILLYGMLISGTRGALFALIVGIFIYLFLCKNIKVLLLGLAVAFSGLFLLKFTYIGNTNYHIYRLRTAVNPENDASMNVRLYNQQRLRNYMEELPFGGGVGVMGYNGFKYNSDKYLASIPPDSYWVKIWGMFGIVGFSIWFGMMMYILGKCCGLVWNIQDKALQVKLIALTAGAGGVFMCSYGNEVMNMLPSSVILYASWVFVYLGPKLDRETPVTEEHG
jgi:O-antigen ligase